jgi:16S rRNA (cytosine1402-N4)-methyltransferase
MIHEPVMVSEIVSIFADVPRGLIVDATYGQGGHTRALENSLKGEFEFLGIERDGEILESPGTYRSKAVNTKKMNFAEIPSMLIDENRDPVSGALFDLGLNSAHLDDSSRGFSYRNCSELDLRFDRASGEPASKVIAKLNEKELIRILKDYGQERNARAIVRGIVKAKPSTTTSLADLIRNVAGPGRFAKSAARVFQALRIYINDELDSLRKALTGIIPLLAPGGRIAVISYHSLEDSIVKREFSLNAGKCFCGPGEETCRCGKREILKIKSKKPLRPSPQEVAANRRARSARLRYAERI